LSVGFVNFQVIWHVNDFIVSISTLITDTISHRAVLNGSLTRRVITKRPLLDSNQRFVASKSATIPRQSCERFNIFPIFSLHHIRSISLGSFWSLFPNLFPLLEDKLHPRKNLHVRSISLTSFSSTLKAILDFIKRNFLIKNYF
jgi:hypothetical protein